MLGLDLRESEALDQARTGSSTLALALMKATISSMVEGDDESLEDVRPFLRLAEAVPSG